MSLNGRRKVVVEVPWSHASWALGTGHRKTWRERELEVKGRLHKISLDIDLPTAEVDNKSYQRENRIQEPVHLVRVLSELALSSKGQGSLICPAHCHSIPSVNDVWSAAPWRSIGYLLLHLQVRCVVWLYDTVVYCFNSLYMYVFEYSWCWIIWLMIVVFRRFIYAPYQVLKRYGIKGPTPVPFFGNYREVAKMVNLFSPCFYVACLTHTCLPTHMFVTIQWHNWHMIESTWLLWTPCSRVRASQWILSRTTAWNSNHRPRYT